MSWPIEYFHYVPGPSSIIEMMPGAMKAMTQCAAVKPGENVVIACDTNKFRLAEALAAAAHAVGGIPTIVMFPTTGAHGAQVPKAVVAACARSDVFFLPTSWSMTHTDARIEAIKNGSRGSTMCEVTEDCLCTGGMLGDYEECDRIARRLGAAMSQSKAMRMTSPAGTDMRSEITGIIVGDVRLMGYGIIKEEPVTIHVREGKVEEITGGSAAEYLKETLESFDDPTAYNLAEFALGLNPSCRAYATNLEDLGKLGFGHHGIGSNYAIGGKVMAPCHIDIIYKDVTAELDGEVVWDKGQLLI
jgi:leucyl aminopeptidase (aminopeptidase T)